MSSVPLDPIEAQRKMQGTWQLPMNEHYSDTLSLYPQGKLLYTCRAASFEERFHQMFVGDEQMGNWHVRSTYKKNALLNSRVGGSIRGSVGSVNFIAPGFQRDGFDSSNVNQDNDTGPFLILNFTELTKSILNPTVAGFRIDIGNLLNNFRELVQDDCLQIVSFTDNDTKLTLRGNRGTTVWHKVEDRFG
jgi:hypothetical protein